MEGRDMNGLFWFDDCTHSHTRIKLFFCSTHIAFFVSFCLTGDEFWMISILLLINSMNWHHILLFVSA